MGSTHIICEDYSPERQASPPGLSEHSADIWLVNISSHLPAISDFIQVLSTDEVNRSTKYRLPNDAQSFIIRRGILRCLLAKYSECKPYEIEFAVGLNRKPILKAPGHPVHFNVSHSNDLALIALSKLEVGIDVEQINDNFNYRDVLINSFSPDEIAFIESSDNPGKRFFNFWTRKEALLKATSKGLDDHLAFIPCLNGNHRIDSKILGSNSEWRVRSFTPYDSYEASIAHQTGIQIKLIEWQPEFLFNF
jgi:4'-phosphopantetheinyl transferase